MCVCVVFTSEIVPMSPPCTSIYTPEQFQQEPPIPWSQVNLPHKRYAKTKRTRRVRRAIVPECIERKHSEAPSARYWKQTKTNVRFEIEPPAPGVHTPRSFLECFYMAKVFRAGFSPARQIDRVLHFPRLCSANTARGGEENKTNIPRATDRCTRQR